MAYSAEDFNLSKNQKAERKLLVTCVNMGDGIDKESGTPKWLPIGVGVEDSAVEYNPSVTTKTDIFGITDTEVEKIEPSQSLDPMTIRGGNPFLFKLNDIIERNAKSELSQFEVMVIRAFIKEGTEAGGYHAEVHRNCTIYPTKQGGSGNVDMPVEIKFSNDKVLGTVNDYKHDSNITFTENS